MDDSSHLASDALHAGIADSASRLIAAIRDSSPILRSELAAKTGMSKAVVSERTRALTEAGLVRETGDKASTGGRRANWLTLDPNRFFVVAVEIAMTHIRVGVIDGSGQLVSAHARDRSMREGPDSVLSEAETMIESIVAEAKVSGPLAGIGVGIAGPVEFSAGRTVHPPVHPDWHDQPVRDRLAVRFGVPVWVDNEVNLMALAEHRLGLGVGVRDLLVIKIGSWVGAGLISNGQLHRGARGSAGSLVTTAGGDDIAAHAELALLSGQSSALAQARESGRKLDAELVAELAQLGHSACQQIMDDAAVSIGTVMSVLVDFFNPALIVVAGGVTSGGDAFLARIREVVYGKALALATRDLRIVRSTLGSNATMLGAGLLAVDELLSPTGLMSLVATVRGQATRRRA